jgi:hypothetical protein
MFVAKDHDTLVAGRICCLVFAASGLHNLSLAPFVGDRIVELLSPALVLRPFGPKYSLTEAQTDQL